jgi:hypothetical protein
MINHSHNQHQIEKTEMKIIMLLLFFNINIGRKKIYNITTTTKKKVPLLILFDDRNREKLYERALAENLMLDNEEKEEEEEMRIIQKMKTFSRSMYMFRYKKNREIKNNI